MSIVLKSNPWGTQTIKLNQVYNGLHFVVDSDLKERANFKYTADIYVNETLVSSLKHHPDVSNSYYGIFNVGPIVENYLSYDLKWKDTTISNSTNSIVQYKVVFGEESSRNINIKKIESLGSGNYKITFKGIHKLKQNDWFYLRGPALSGWFNTYEVYNNTSIRTNTTTNLTLTESGANGHFIQEGTYFINAQNVTYNGVSNLAILIPTWNNIKVGDKLILSQTANLTNTPSTGYTAYEKNEWTVLAINTVQYFGTSYYKLTLDARSQGNISIGISGKVIITSPYKLTTLTTDKAMAFNGVLQYNEFLDWSSNVGSYMPNGTTKKFLTDMSRTQSLSLDEHFTLSMFGTSFNTSAIPTYATRVQFKFYSLFPLVFNGTTSNSGGYTKITLSTPGDFTATPIFDANNEIVSSNYNGKITSEGYSTNQYIITNIPWSGTSESISFQVNLINYRTQDISTLTAWRVDIPCGPANIKSYLDSTSWYSIYGLTKYEVYGVDGNWNVCTEKFSIELKTNCGNNKRFRLMWLNQNGAFDYFTFDLKYDDKTRIERNIYNKQLGKVQSGTNQFTYQRGDRQNTNFNTNAIKQLTLRSNFLNQNELNLLEWLYISPEVYFIDESTLYIYPVNVIDTEIQRAQKINYGQNGTLYNYTINIEYGQNLTVQRGGWGNNLSPVNSTPITATPWSVPSPSPSPWTFNGGGGLTLPQYGWNRDTQASSWY